MRNNNPFLRMIHGITARFRNIFGRNIATIIFSVLFLYMVVSAIFYMTSGHIESYQVTAGPLSMNETYTGLALREESIISCDTGGYLVYYAREGDKINANGAVYGLSATKNPEVTTRLSQEDLSKVRNSMMSFSRNFDPSRFSSTYSFKYQLEGSILQYSGVTGRALTVEEDSEGDESSESEKPIASSVTFGNQTICKAATDGIIRYSKDGYEGKTLDTLSKDDFDQNAYRETDLKKDRPVKAGEEIYTIVTDERWSLLIPLSEKQAVKLQDRAVVRVKFLKDDMTQSGDFSIIKIDGAKYGKLDFNKGLVRYATDRFLDIELVTNTVTGLKIPLTSIVTKDFYTIPSTFANTDSETGEETFLVQVRGENGETETKVVSPIIYATVTNPKKTLTARGEDPEAPTYTYYVDKNVFAEGDAIVREGSKSKYIVGETAALEGVYCINQGYAVFRRIDILDQNEEYAIVSKYTNYGLVRYDHIVKDASRVKEEDILY